MRLLTKIIHPSLSSLEGKTFERQAVRGIILDGEELLLLYTKRYNDYSLPGGGVDPEEDLHQALLRELQEETGAQNIRIEKEFGFIDEYRPYHKPEWDLVHMISKIYLCSADRKLGQTQMETYEVKNGMEPLWVNIHEAIAHNEKVMAHQEKSMGLSIERETFVLKKIVEELLETPSF